MLNGCTKFHMKSVTEKDDVFRSLSRNGFKVLLVHIMELKGITKVYLYYCNFFSFVHSKGVFSSEAFSFCHIITRPKIMTPGQPNNRLFCDG